LLFVLDADQDRQELVRQCRNIGYERLLGELDGGFDAWLQAGGNAASIPLVAADDIAGRLVDVRQRGEYVAGHIPDAIHVELGSIAATTLKDGPLTLSCGHGERAMTAASVLEAGGRTELSILPGGASAWSLATGRPLDR
jgi:hydroxyacylglutathione hydrolase